MARRVNQTQIEETQVEDEAAPENLSDSPPIQGGAPGVIPEAVRTIEDPSVPTAAIPVAAKRDLGSPPKRYIVERGGRVNSHGYGFDMKTGKILDAGQYDIEGLRHQGIGLREIE